MLFTSNGERILPVACFCIQNFLHDSSILNKNIQKCKTLKGDIETMFKNKDKWQNFVKKQVAKVLAVVMAFSSFASTGMAISSAHAATASVDDHGKAFVGELVDITAAGTKYVWGGWLNPDVDCRGFVRGALKNVYGLDIYNTAGYLVDDDGNPIDKNGKQVSANNKVYIDVAAYDARATLSQYVGKRICVEGNGIKTYYRVAVADYCYNLKNGGGNRWSEMPGNALDIKTNGSTYSSLIAYACQFPGSIISHNGHYGVGIGEFHSAAEIAEKYPGLSGNCSGTAGGKIIRWSASCYNLGNSYSEDDPRYWFGKTVFLSACSTKSGIRADSFTTTGKTPNPDSDSTLSILLCENVEETVEISFEKLAHGTNTHVAGAVYGVYTDAACSKQVTTFTTNSQSVKLTLNKDVYYVKELKAPSGYAISGEVVQVDATGKSNTVSVKLYDNPVNATVIVRKVDANDTGISLSGTKLKIQEYNSKTSSWGDLVDLKYDNNAQVFTISSSYTNNEGVKYNDGSLHYSETNQGRFKLVEVRAQNGYYLNSELNSNNKDEREFSIVGENGGSLILTGNNAIKNTAKLSLLINKVNALGEPLAGAKFLFRYNGVDYKGTTDENGQLLFDNIPEGSTNTGVLYETLPPEGHYVLDNYIFGQSVALNKTTCVNGCYQTTIRVVNGTQEAPPPEPTEGTIVIKKRDGSSFENIESGGIGVPNTYYTIYTDAALTQVASDLDGNKLERLKTDKDGKIIVDRLALGVYYVREVEPPNGYAIQLKTFPVNLLDGDAVVDDKGNATVIAEPEGINDPRQIVKLSLQKVDEMSGKPVAGAVYALYAASDLKVAEQSLTVAAGTLLGYYQTDANGMIEVDSLTTTAFEANGKNYLTVNIISKEGPLVEAGGLVNGNYYFIEDSAPTGYVLDTTKININAGWEMNLTDKDLAVSGGVVSAAGRYLTKNTVVVKEERQTVTIHFTKKDKDTASKDVNSLYKLNSYGDAVANKMAANLEGAVYHLINTQTIIDTVTGDWIPAGTVLGVYETNANGEFTAAHMTIAAYEGHPLPNGTYKFVEACAPQGYAINNEEISVDARWTSAQSNSSIIGLKANTADEILKQSLTINKKSNTGAALSGVSFELYSVAEVLEQCEISFDELPWDSTSEQVNGYYAIDRNAFASLIETNNLKPVADKNGKSVFITNSEGSVTTGLFIYGDYILYEVAAPNGHIASNATYIQLPWVEYSVEGSAPDGSEAGSDVVTIYLHDVSAQPTGPYIQEVVNEKIPEKTNYTVTKVWNDNDNLYGVRPDSIQVQLYADNKAVGSAVTLNESNGWSYTWTDLARYTDLMATTLINYQVDEINVPNHYTKSVDGSTITNTCTYVPTTSFTVIKNWADNNDAAGKRPSSIDVQLYADGVACGNVIALSQDNNWSYTWGDLVKYKEGSLTQINYTVDEVVTPKYYNKVVNGNVITNTYIEPEKIDFLVVKNWDDNDNQYGFRPNSISVQLYADGVAMGPIVSITAEQNWSYTWTKLLKYDDDDREIVYTVDEIVVPEYYEKSIVNDTQIDSIPMDLPSQMIKTSTITNTCTYVPPVVEFTVNKEWDDNDDEYGLRPNSISVQLFADGVACGPVISITEQQNWTYTWTDLAQYSDGVSNLITYTVDEVVVPENYEKTVDGNKIINKCIPPIRPTVIVSKSEMIDAEQQAVAGATLQILDSNGNVVSLEDGTRCEWTTTTDMLDEYGVVGHLIDNLPAGTYILHEAVAPEGYATADDIEFVVEHTNDPQYVSMIEQPLSVEVSKLDSENNMHIVGAELAIVDSDGNIVVDKDGNSLKWTTTDSAKLIKYIPVGTYYLREINTPVGYQRAQDVEFTVVDSNETVVLTMKDARTYGTLELTKHDAVTKEVLEGVVFHFISVDEVKDPVTGAVIYTAGQVIEELVTDADGYAKLANNVPIGIYGQNGFVESIRYQLIEVVAAEGQYDASAVNCYITFAYEGDSVPVVNRTLILENNKPIITVTKTGSPETFVGQYDDRHNVTVVRNKDRIEYFITVTNSGTAAAYNVVVRDPIPTNTTFVDMANVHNNEYDETNNMVYWTIDKIDAGEIIVLTFAVKVDSEQACEIVNVAQYAMPNIIPTEPEDYLDPKSDDNDWINTDAVVHQTVTIDKDSSIKHGVDGTDAPYVPIGAQFTYIITFNTTNTVYGVTVHDIIPKGLTFVPGTATYTLAGGEIIQVDNVEVQDDNLLIFPTIDEIGAGLSTFTFDVKVENVAEYDREYYFINKAGATVKESNESEKEIELETNTVSHKTIKTNETKEPVLGFDTTNESVMWSMIAVVSAITMVLFGLYGFSENKKKRR
jgi:uncharacterized repeat protein (TIGR01451 family)